MFIQKTEQNLVKITYNPQEEVLLLADLLKIISPGQSGVLAQVVKIEALEDENYNIATAKTIYTIQSSGKLSGWQGNIPGKNFKVRVIEPDELLAILGVENYENPIAIGVLSSDSQTVINIDSTSLEKPAVVVGDRESSRNDFIKNIAEELAENNKVVIIDSNGDFLDIEDAEIIQAGKHLKLPLDSVGLENLYTKTLSGFSAETRANIENVFSEIDEYLASGEVSHIPFNSFLIAINEEVEANTMPELSLLSNSLTKLKRKGLFADNHAQISKLFSSFKKNNLVVVDLSEIEETWKEEFVEAIIRLNSKLKTKFYLINTLENAILAKKSLNQGTKSGISTIFSLGHNSQVLKEILAKTENVFSLRALNGTGLSYLQDYLPMLSESEAIVCGKITNNIPLIINIAADLENYPEIVIEDSYTEEVEEIQPIEQDLEEEPEEYEEQLPEEEEQELEEQIEEEQVEDDVEEEQVIQDNNYHQSDLNLLLDNDDQEDVQQELQEEYPGEDEQEYEEEEGDESQQEYSEDDEFDYSQSEEFQDESVLDYADTEEPEKEAAEEEEQYITQEVNQEFSEEDLQNFMDLDDEEEQEQVEEVVEVQQIQPERSAKKEMPGPPTPDLPIYSASDNQQDGETADDDLDLQEGDEVRHKKYGVGIIKKVIGYSERKLCSIQFEEVGRRLLDPKLAELELVSKI